MAGRGRRWSVLLLASNSAMGFVAGRCLSAAGERFRLLAGTSYPSIQALRGCVGGRRHPRELYEPGDDRLLRIVSEELARQPDAVVIPCGIAATLYLAHCQDQLPPGSVFPVPDEHTAIMLNDKWQFAQLVAKLGLPHPSTSLITSEAELAQQDVRYPALVKPLTAEASQGIDKVDGPEQLARAVAGLEEAGLLPVLVQEFIPGEDHGVGILADHGQVLACRIQSLKGGGAIAFTEQADALEMAVTLAEATGFHGVAEFDLRSGERGGRWLLLECNPRFWASMHKAAWAGANLVELGLRLARGEAVAYHPPVTTLVQDPLAVAAQLVRRRGDEVTEASREALRAELRDPLASVLRALEWRLPKLAERITAEPVTPWNSR